MLRDGLARLLTKGAYFPRAEFPFAATYTATGHAALATGAAPSDSGILANTWYDPTTETVVAATTDPLSAHFAPRTVAQVSNDRPIGAPLGDRRPRGCAPSRTPASQERQHCTQTPCRHHGPRAPPYTGPVVRARFARVNDEYNSMRRTHRNGSPTSPRPIQTPPS